MRILVDAMGGDLAPDEIVKGAVHAQQELGAEIVLVGQRAAIESCLRNEQAELEIIDASEVITMDDDPSTATRRKKDASMTVALNLLRDGKGDAVVSAGSTGALLTGATLIVKRIHGIRRAALAPVLPNGDAGVMLIDCGRERRLHAGVPAAVCLHGQLLCPHHARHRRAARRSAQQRHRGPQGFGAPA